MSWRDHHHRHHHHHHHRHLRAHAAHRFALRGAPLWMHWRLRRRMFASFTIVLAISGCLGSWLVHRGISPVWAVGLSVVMLWMSTGAIAWKLTMPLVELSQVARKLGDGDLGARMRTHHHGARELAMIASSINDMAARIEKQLRDQRELLAAVSHEIRTPLGHLRILLDTVRERGLAEADVGELEREVLEIDALVDQLLASSRLDFGALERRELDVAVEAARALERLGVDAAVLDVESDACVVSADPTLLRSALANLVRNAVEHAGGVARVAVRRTLEAVEVDVEDRGPGFTPEDLPRVFEPFYRGSSQGSLGLGLSLVDRVARAHGGSARASNREGGGAMVRLRLLLPERG
jgi:two-component system, OmpR family, sensor kinase